MLDDDHGVALIDQRMQHFQQFAHIVEMQAGGRFIENIKRLARRAAREFLGQLDALRLAARQGRRRLPDLDIAQARRD